MSTRAWCGWTCCGRVPPRPTAPTRARRRTGRRHIGDVVLDDVAWSYEDPLPESAPLRHYLSFDDSRVTVVHDIPEAG